jgi:hypothetical protein
MLFTSLRSLAMRIPSDVVTVGRNKQQPRNGKIARQTSRLKADDYKIFHDLGGTLDPEWHNLDGRPKS